MRASPQVVLLALLIIAGLAFGPLALAAGHGHGQGASEKGGRGKGKDKNKDKEKGDAKDQEDEDAAQAKGGDQEKGGGQGKGGGEGKGGAQGKGGPRDPDFRPPGWDKGQKKGWDDEYPPGWDKKTDAEKDKWRADVLLGREEVGRHADKHEVRAEERSKYQEALERLARKGRGVPDAVRDVRQAIEQRRTAVQVLLDAGITVEVTP